MKTKRAMMDLETTGTKPGCPILSIGAVSFTLEDGVQEKFYEKIRIETCFTAGLSSSKSTLDWWLTQPDEARDEAFSGTRDLTQVLQEFTFWLALVGAEENWANGIDFDFPILSHAYIAVGLLPPWKYNSLRDYRTLSKLFPEIKPPYDNPLKHSAISDSIYQAEHLIEILEEIKRND